MGIDIVETFKNVEHFFFSGKLAFQKCCHHTVNINIYKNLLTLYRNCKIGNVYVLQINGTSVLTGFQRTYNLIIILFNN